MLRPLDGPLGVQVRAARPDQNSHGPATLEVRRVRLLERLEGPVVATVLSAPAGFGKSTAAQQWLADRRADGSRTVRLALSATDSDPVVLARRLLEAVVAVAPEVARPAGRTPRDPEGQVASLLSRLDRRIPLAFVIDDLQYADASAGAVLRTLVCSLPENCRALLLTRGRSMIRLADEVARGRAQLLRAQDLRFTPAEARTLLSDALPPRLIPEALEVSAGWPVALQLLRLWVCERRSEASDRVRSFSGSSPNIARYLAEHLLADVDEPLATFMLEAATLDHFSGDVLNASLERADSWSRLDDLDRRGLFIEPHDANGHQFHFMPLVAGFLREQLHRRSPGRARTIQRRAAEWFAASGETGAALHAAGRADDTLLAAAILDRAGGWRYALTAGCDALSILRKLDPDQLAQFPRAAFAVVYSVLQSGRSHEARALFDQILARRPLTTVPSDGDPERFHLALEARQIDLVTRMYADLPILETEIAELERMSAAPQGYDPLINGPILTIFSMFGLSSSGRLRAADRVGAKLLDGVDRFETPYFALWALVYVSIVSLACGRPREAEALLRRCLAAGSDSTPAPPTQAARVMLAVIADERGEDTEFELTGSSIEVLDNCGGWFDLSEATLDALAARLTRTESVDSTLRMLDARQRYFEATDRPRIAKLLGLLAVRELALAGEHARAESRARAEDLRGLADGGLPAGHWHRRLQDFAQYTLGRLHLALGQPAEALARLSTARAAYDEAGAVRVSVRARIGEVLAAEALGDRALALESLEQAVSMAAAEELRRPFRDDAAALKPLLRELQSRNSHMSATARALVDALVVERHCRSGNAGSPLSPRERAVLAMLADGLSSKEMARRLGVAESTIKGYRKSLFEKLGAHTRGQAIATGRARELIS